jgi:hypothetical protein
MKSDQITGGGPAFPCKGFKGLSTRDYFAAKALQSLIVVRCEPYASNYDWGLLTAEAYDAADAMLWRRSDVPGGADAQQS